MTKAKYLKWTPQEAMLIYYEIDKQHSGPNDGKISWKDISRVVKSKTPRQCFDWYYIRRKRRSYHAHSWTYSEINKLQALHAYGKKVREISAHFEGMSISQVRNKLRYVLYTQEKPSEFDVYHVLYIFAQM